MASPFPGMDPYLEGSVWPDLHHTLTGVIRKVLMQILPARYIAFVEKYVVHDTEPYHDIGIMYPDVEILKKASDRVEEPQAAYHIKSPFTPPSFLFKVQRPVEVNVPFIEIRDKENNKVITAIEILSPVNKRSPGLKEYLKKRNKLMANGIHLIEIDLLRRGKRMVKHASIKNSDYVVILNRNNESYTNIWAMTIMDNLPVIPVPLAPPDNDISLDLQQVFNISYSDAGYSRSVNYSKPPPSPTFSEENKKWIKERLKGKSKPYG